MKSTTCHEKPYAVEVSWHSRENLRFCGAINYPSVVFKRMLGPVAGRVVTDV